MYQDTCTFVDKDATITTHKSETSSKKIIQKSKEGSDLVFSIMDPSIDERVAFEGGEKGTDGSYNTYTEPETVKNIELAFKVFPMEGLVLNIPCATVSAKKNTTYSAKGISLLDVTANPNGVITYSENPTMPEE